MTQEITLSEFKSKVLEAKNPVLVDFFATWCSPCKVIAPTIDEIAKEQAGKIDVYKIDVDENYEIAAQYDVMSVPTLMVFENGQVKNRMLGAQPKEQILALLS